MKKPEYDWLGDWQGPEHGKYVIRADGREMEPHEVIDILNDYQDLLEQITAGEIRAEVVKSFDLNRYLEDKINEVLK